MFGPLKAAYRDQVERLYRGGANTVGKEHFTSLYSPAREKALTPRNIKAGWTKAGLCSFNPDRVLRDIQKPLAELTVPKADEVKMGSCPQGEDAHTLDETSKLRLQKLANAAQVSFADCALLLDENRLLFQQNNESKCRKSTKLTILGKAKVMSYEDIVEAQAKRAAKEAAKDAAAVKGKRGRKRESPAPAGAKAQRRMRLSQEGWEIDYCSVLQLLIWIGLMT
ncbi:hypothetical protein POJ06DRAFT_287402 [Lipomyces tetrasporus]|uniref:Uncharacterized protein n=1 Tax=Lipomyces tetrasporus TaxID=54092 RepID=A0AAD7QJU3_9ASCO|nr:uncharacterized protein POJ06DRAFT_287402 [Lipomyces tetrasporus]KAJ8096508.1 hypothetical protein POJ06DRAFT_287402 [Lipomyces tetrasporus]